MRLVFDTGIYLNAFSVRQSRAGEAVLKAIDAGDVLIASREMISTVVATISSVVSHDPVMLNEVALYLEQSTRIVYPAMKVRVFLDKTDNLALECAQTGKADAIVTESRRILKLGTFERVRIISLSGYLGISRHPSAHT